jgi:Zincin-like metallopeptidase
VPISRTRAETFDDLVLDSLEKVEDAVRDDRGLAARLAEVELGVEDVPPEAALDAAADGEEMPLARSEPAAHGHGPRLVVYRRPVELRSPNQEDLVHELVVDLLAELLGVTPERLDPSAEDEGP